MHCLTVKIDVEGKIYIMIITLLVSGLLDKWSEYFQYRHENLQEQRKAYVAEYLSAYLKSYDIWDVLCKYRE